MGKWQITAIGAGAAIVWSIVLHGVLVRPERARMKAQQLEFAEEKKTQHAQEQEKAAVSAVRAAVEQEKAAGEKARLFEASTADKEALRVALNASQGRQVEQRAELAASSAAVTELEQYIEGQRERLQGQSKSLQLLLLCVVAIGLVGLVQSAGNRVAVAWVAYGLVGVCVIASA